MKYALWQTIRMENHQFSWENSLFLGPFSVAICESLPEGNTFEHQTTSKIVKETLPALQGCARLPQSQVWAEPRGPCWRSNALWLCRKLWYTMGHPLTMWASSLDKLVYKPHELWSYIADKPCHPPKIAACMEKNIDNS